MISQCLNDLVTGFTRAVTGFNCFIVNFMEPVFSAPPGIITVFPCPNISKIGEPNRPTKAFIETPFSMALDLITGLTVGQRWVERS